MTVAYATNKSACRTFHGPQNASWSDSSTLSPCDFDTYIRQYTAQLLAVARRILRSEEDAADAVQDGLLSAFASRHSFHGNSTVYTWLYRIVVNVYLMKIRSRPRAKTVSLNELLPTFGDCGRHAHPVSAWTEHAGSRLEREETRAAVRAGINQLPDDYRRIVLLRDIEEFDTGQTAELLGLSRVAVKTRLHRARQSLRTLLERTAPHFSARGCTSSTKPDG